MLSGLSNVVHVTSWLSRAGGGMPPVIWSLAQEMQRAGIRCQVAGLRDRWNGQDFPKSTPVITGGVQGPAALGYSRELSRRIPALLQHGSVVHVHGLWMFPGVVGRQSARKMGCPLVVSPHGMLEPWALKNSPWKKKFASWLFENQNLRSANCLHALCAAEAENFRHLGLRNPIAIIPNGVGLETKAEMLKPWGAGRKSEVEAPDVGEGAEGERKVLLFLSRLHPKKGLENLLLAWARMQKSEGKTEEWGLVIAGSGDAAYERKLRGIVESYGLGGSVLLRGPVYGEEKEQLLAEVDGFVLPSFSEGFSMAVLEAAAAGLPVILTRECNFPELAGSGAALEVAPEASAIEVGLRRLLSLTDQERKAMGRRGRTLVQLDYTWPAVTAKMLNVYQWLLGSAPKPICVI